MGIKFIDPKAVIKVVSISDDAIDKVNSNLVEYQQSYDISLLKFHEGVVPTYFVIGNVGSPEIVQIQQDHYVTEVPAIQPGQSLEEMKLNKVKVKPVKSGEMLVKYFKFGVKKVIDGQKEFEINDETLITIPSNVLQEIGSFIMLRSVLNESKKKS